MQIIDMHCDTISKIRQMEKEGSPASLFHNSLSVDLEKMKKGGYALQTFAIYVNWEEEPDAEAAAGDILKIFQREMQRNADLISQVRTYSELEDVSPSLPGGGRHIPELSGFPQMVSPTGRQNGNPYLEL